MKRNLIIIGVVFTMTCLAWWGIAFALSHKTVVFNLKGSGYDVLIHTSKGREVAKISSSQEVTLREGDYIYNIIGDHYEQDITSLIITKDTEVHVTPRYTEEFASELSKTEQVAITSILKEQYPSIKELTIASMSIDTTNTWAYGKLTVKGSSGDIYRFIMKHNNNTWHTAIKPTIAIQRENAKDIPEEILNALY